ncbi:hypothetical protein WJX72_009337 [[Myrmecia] bisecta]|uniref:Uncharacterized protein n=1 Tax=[Myrmecia] bisecta TaxID=41462 RepID=A0AAW1Q5D5_9CHLO
MRPYGFVRGKKRCGFDYPDLVLEWEAVSDASIKGTARVLNASVEAICKNAHLGCTCERDSGHDKLASQQEFCWPRICRLQQNTLLEQASGSQR